MWSVSQNIMSNKNPKDLSRDINATPEAETSAVRKDVIQTVLTNLLFIGLLIGLHYWNQANGQPLDKFVGKFINL